MFKVGEGITEVPVGHPLSCKKRERFFLALNIDCALLLLVENWKVFYIFFLRAEASRISR